MAERERTALFEGYSGLGAVREQHYGLGGVRERAATVV